MPPTLATSATSGRVFSSYFRNQSCSARSCGQVVLAAAVDQRVLVDPADAGGVGAERGLGGLAGSRPWTWFRYSSTRERAQYRSVPSSNIT